MSGKNNQTQKQVKNKNSNQNKKNQPSNSQQGKKDNVNKQDSKPKKNDIVDKPKPIVTKPLQVTEPIPNKDADDVSQTEEATESTYGKYRKRKIETNWTREELPENIYDTVEQTSRAANLHDLFNKPSSLGDHFQFKSEKHWGAEQEQPDEDLFGLDCKKISEHILCVPFYEVIDIDKTSFTATQVEEMNKVSEKNKLLYQFDPKVLSSRKDDISMLSSKFCDVLKGPVVEEEKNFSSYIEDQLNQISSTPNLPIATNLFKKPEIDSDDDELDKLLELSTCPNEYNKNPKTLHNSSTVYKKPESSNTIDGDNDELDELLKLSKHPIESIKNPKAEHERENDASTSDLEGWLSEYLTKR